MTGIEDVEAVRWWHMEGGNNWPGIAYAVCLAEETNGGPIARYNTSDLDLVRYHIASRNHECVGVSCLTDFGNTIPQDKWINALAEVLRELKVKYPGAEIVGHKEITVPGYGTRCPGDRWFEWKPRLLRLVEATDYAAFFAPFPYVERFGIPTTYREWHKRGKGWGQALTAEEPFNTGTAQRFEKAIATWNPKDGVQVYMAGKL